MNRFLKELNEIDAAIYSGDAMEKPANVAALKTYVARWMRAVKEREGTPDTSSFDDAVVAMVNSWEIGKKYVVQRVGGESVLAWPHVEKT